MRKTKNFSTSACRGAESEGVHSLGFIRWSWIEHSIGALLQPLESSQTWPHAPHPVRLTGEVQVLEKENEATGEEEEGMSRRGGGRQKEGRGNFFWGGGSKRSNNSENPKQRKIKLVGSIADLLVKCMDSNGQKQALFPYVT